MEVRRADPVRLKRAFAEFRLAVWLDAMERWYGGDRKEALKHASADMLIAAGIQQEAPDDTP